MHVTLIGLENAYSIQRSRVPNIFEKSIIIGLKTFKKLEKKSLLLVCESWEYIFSKIKIIGEKYSITISSKIFHNN